MCEYDDGMCERSSHVHVGLIHPLGKGKTRTQLLREHIGRLEQRIRELEDPEHAAPGIALYDPHATFYDETSSVSAGSSPTSIPALPACMPGMPLLHDLAYNIQPPPERPNTPYSVAFSNFTVGLRHRHRGT
jgi:hypothetical protein